MLIFPITNGLIKYPKQLTDRDSLQKKIIKKYLLIIVVSWANSKARVFV